MGKKHCSSCHFPCCRSTLCLVYLITVLFIPAFMGLHESQRDEDPRGLIASQRTSSPSGNDGYGLPEGIYITREGKSKESEFLAMNALTCSTLACWQWESLYYRLHVLSYNFDP